MTPRWLGLGFVLSMAVGAGCYGAGDASDATDTTEDSSDAVVSSRAWGGFVGAWVGVVGPFRGLVFTRTVEGAGHHWFADAGENAICDRAPCPATSRIEGVFTATTRTLDLRPSDPRLGVAVGTFGSYACSLRGDNLVLSQGGRVVARLRKAPSYCGEADDCAEQSLTAPACVGAWACTAARACSYACSPTSVGEGQVCGGVAGPRCIDGLSCVREGSLPEASGVCRRASNCASVRCEAGFMCRETDGQCVLVGEPCGNTHCAEGLRCCNPLRGICTRPGAYCIQ